MISYFDDDQEKLVEKLIEFSKSTNEYLNKRSILDYIRFVLKNDSGDVGDAIECLNFNFTQFFEYCKTVGGVRAFKKDYLE